MNWPLSRRRLLQLGALATTEAWITAQAPRVLAQRALGFPRVRRMQVSRPEPGLVEATLVAAPVTVQVAGHWATLWTYNGSFPGPLLEVHEGDQVRLHFTNGLPEETNLHLHGLHISPAVDDPFLSVPSGESVLYEFTIPRGARGVHWYHPHVHGRVARQLFAGLAGTILVHAVEDDAPERSDQEDRLIVLKDLELTGGRPAPHGFADWLAGKEGSLLLVNGAVDPVLIARRSVLRLRLLNASNARYYRLALEDHVLHLVATDGGLLASPVALDELLLAPGERAEVLLQLERPGRFALLDLPYDRGAMHMGGMGGMRGTSGEPEQPARLMSIVAPPGLKARSLPTRLASVWDVRREEPDVTRRLVLGEGMMATLFSINGRPFDPERVDSIASVGALERWEIVNPGRMDHPFHLHTYSFQVLSRNGAAEPLLAWKDVVNVGRRETVRIAVPLRDLIGRTVYHCHIAEHEDRGMMGTLEVTGSP